MNLVVATVDLCEDGLDSLGRPFLDLLDCLNACFHLEESGADCFKVTLIQFILFQSPHAGLQILGCFLVTFWLFFDSITLSSCKLLPL